MAHQHEAGWKTNEKGYDKCRDMGLEGDVRSQVKDLFVQYEIVCKEKYEDVESRVESSANGISESLQGKESSERGIEIIYSGNDLLFSHKSSDSGREVNINGQIVYPTNTTFASNLT